MRTFRTVLGGLVRADLRPLTRIAAGPWRVNRVVVMAVGLVGIAGLAYVDWHTGPAVGVEVVYALIVMGVAYHATWIDGAIVGVVAAGAGFLDDVLNPADELGVPVVLWGLLSELGVFLIMVVIIRQIESFVAELNALSRFDGLTGVPNTRAVLETLERERTRADRAGEPLTVAFMDLDQLKKVNDTLGHGAGDETLTAFAGIVLGSIRTHDTFGRVGGDEFVLILPHTDQEQAVAVIDRLQAAIAAGSSAVMPRVSASVGVVTYLAALPSPQAMLNAADSLMYRAKRAGGGRVLGQVVAGGDGSTEAAIVFDLAERNGAGPAGDTQRAATA